MRHRGRGGGWERRRKTSRVRVFTHKLGIKLTLFWSFSVTTSMFSGANISGIPLLERIHS